MSASSPRHIHKEMRRSYDFEFKVMAILEAEETNNCAAARQFKRHRKQRLSMATAEKLC
jgi:hypothetical protein